MTDTTTNAMTDDLRNTLEEAEGIMERIEAHPRWRGLALREPVAYTRFTVARDLILDPATAKDDSPAALGRARAARDSLARLMARLEPPSGPRPMA